MSQNESSRADFAATPKRGAIQKMSLLIEPGQKQLQIYHYCFDVRAFHGSEAVTFRVSQSIYLVEKMFYKFGRRAGLVLVCSDAPTKALFTDKTPLGTPRLWTSRQASRGVRRQPGLEPLRRLIGHPPLTPQPALSSRAFAV